MKFQTVFLTIATFLTALNIGLVAKADSTEARCDIYPAGEDIASAVVPCTFSQRQGEVRITLQDGTTYELSPTGDQPGNYIDQNGQAAYRQAGLGDQGQIYQMDNETIYVYWDPAIGSSEPSTSSAQSSTPVTYVTDVRDGVIVMQITESGSEFRFHGYLERTSGNTFQGEDDNVRVMYDRDTGRVVVINRVTGDEYYNYFYSTTDEGAL